MAGILSVCLFVVCAIIEVDEPTWLTVTGLAFLALSIPFAVLPFFHLVKYGNPKPGGSFLATTRVASRGVYALVRHPQYLGYSFLVMGFGFLEPHPAVLALMGAAVTFFYLQCVFEERFCRAALGEDYERYMKRVPRVNILLGLFRFIRKTDGGR